MVVLKPPPQQRYATGEPGKVQGRNRVGIVVQWVASPRGQYSGKIRFIEKPGLQDEGIATWLNVVLTPPSAGVRHGRARQSSGTGLCGDCRRVLWIPVPRVLVLGYKTRWVATKLGTFIDL